MSKQRVGTRGASSSVLALLAISAVATVGAQAPARSLDCDDGWRGWLNRSARACEVREVTIPATGSLSVDGGQNGGVTVGAWERNEVLVRALVQAWNGDEDEARATVEQVVVSTDGGIRAEGPDRRGASWSVSYEIFVPRSTDLRLETRNGGITIAGVRGALDLAARNGGIKLDAVGGNVRGHTTNGGVDVTLVGDTWDGEALDVRTTNGGIRLRIPEEYSARLETGTVNGGIDIDFPVTVQGRIGRDLNATLGDGGPLVTARTTNGGVRVMRY